MIHFQNHGNLSASARKEPAEPEHLQLSAARDVGDIPESEHRDSHSVAEAVSGLLIPQLQSEMTAPSEPEQSR